MEEPIIRVRFMDGRTISRCEHGRWFDCEYCADERKRVNPLVVFCYLQAPGRMFDAAGYEMMTIWNTRDGVEWIRKRKVDTSGWSHYFATDGEVK
jgi:hypothetical protein